MLKRHGKEERAELSVRETLVVKGYLEGLTASQSMISAGYARSTSISRPFSVLGKSRVRAAIRSEMAGMGLSIGQMLKVGLEATTPTLVGSKIIEIPDHSTRLRYIEAAIRLIGLEKGVE